MKHLLLATLMSTVAMSAGTALAQSSQCDTLVAYIEQNQAAQMPAGMTIDRARALKTEGNEAECTTVYQQIAQTGQAGADSEDANATPEAQEGQAQGQGATITVQETAPTITVNPATPQITVQQPQPTVTVRQPQPEIIVRQPAPVVTIDIPQPEIIVRMPQPEVAVQQAQPTVQVQQGEPQVSVVQPEQPQVQVQETQPAQVQLTQPEGQANVQVEQTGEANVTYERAEPQVTINQAEGEPTVTIEQMEGQAGAGQTAATGLRDSEDPNATAELLEGAAGGDGTAAAGQMQRVALADFNGMNVVNERGDDLGEVEGIVRSSADNKMYVVIENGGFLGIGENRIALSLEGLVMRGKDLVVPGLTDEAIRALPKFEASDQFPTVDDAEVEVRTAS